MADGVTYTETDLMIARTGIKVQWDAHKGDVDAFLEHMARCIAADRAYIRMQSNALHGYTGIEEKSSKKG